MQWVGRVFFSKNKKKRPCIRHILVGNPSSGFSHVSLIKSRVCKREEKDKKITTIIHTFCICGATNIIYTYIYIIQQWIFLEVTLSLILEKKFCLLFYLVKRKSSSRVVKIHNWIFWIFQLYFLLNFIIW